MFDAFVQIAGISGESTDDLHPGWIEIRDYNVAVSQAVSQTQSSAGGASAERADFSTFTFSKLLDNASPALALACADGTHVNTILVDLCRAGSDKVRFMQYKFTNCMISSVFTSSDGGFPEDHVAFVYGQVEWHYTRQMRTGGGPAGNLAAGWSLEKNCSV